MGEFQKGVNGDVSILNLSQSKRPVELHERVIQTFFPYIKWNHIRTIAIGERIEVNIKGDIKLVVLDKDFRSASDVPEGGFDFHFDEVWGELRQRR